MSEPAVESLTVDECWKLMATADLGRVGVALDGGVDIYPVNFMVKDQMIYFSSAPGPKLVEMTRHPRVAFEVDGISNRRRWSVVVRGEAKRLGFDSEIEESGVRFLHTLTRTDKWNYVRIEPRLVTGRRFISSRR
jgi:nitroimidazol reductase NimA-like FMN-containing flavoprotein (pyridoxamine 5'-phosphate oxidase superfamily)